MSPIFYRSPRFTTPRTKKNFCGPSINTLSVKKLIVKFCKKKLDEFEKVPGQQTAKYWFSVFRIFWNFLIGIIRNQAIESEVTKFINSNFGFNLFLLYIFDYLSDIHTYIQGIITKQKGKLFFFKYNIFDVELNY